MKKFMISTPIGMVLLFATIACYASDEKIGVFADVPSSSPASGDVVFSADFDGPTRLWVAQASGANLHKISTLPNALSSIYETEPSWSPDGRQIAYVTITNGRPDIWIVQSSGANSIQLTSNGSNNTRPAWSPDGKKITYVSDKGGSKDIWIMNSDGTAQTKIIGLAGQENHPTFSPAGDKIVFSETSNGSANLMVANVDGSNAKALTNTGFQDWDPYWTTKGIIFSSNRDTSSEHWKIWTVQADGSGLHKIGNVIGLSPAALPDGRILFVDETSPSKALSSIAILNPADGSKKIAVDVQGYSTPVDIRPGNALNNVNPKSQGKMEVAILSTQTLDAVKSVSPSTITFGRTGNEPSLNKCDSSGIDVNDDGLPDLVCRFLTNKGGFQASDTVGIVRFTSTDGIPYEGRDTVRIVGTGD